MNLLTAAVRDQGTTLVLVTHEPRVAAYADREVIVRDGKVNTLTAAGSGHDPPGPAADRERRERSRGAPDPVAAAVALGVGLVLMSLAGINAVNNQNARYAWLGTGTVRRRPPDPRARPRPGSVSGRPAVVAAPADHFAGQTIARVDVAATGPDSPVPPGIPRLPGPGQFYASPALSALLHSTPAGELGDRFPGHQVGTIGAAALPAPNSLIIIIGHTASQLSHLQLSHVPGAAEVRSISATSPSSCSGTNCAVGAGINANGIDLILSVVACALLFPVLIFIGTATRLSAARREQRFAAMRLVGATPRQVSVISAVESTVAAVAGVAAGSACSSCSARRWRRFPSPARRSSPATCHSAPWTSCSSPSASRSRQRPRRAWRCGGCRSPRSA